MQKFEIPDSLNAGRRRLGSSLRFRIPLFNAHLTVGHRQSPSKILVLDIDDTLRCTF